MAKSRLEAFSDGVIAIAVTLLVLDIQVPSPGRLSLAHRIGEQWPQFAAYAISFLTIGIIWINHHAMLRRLAAVDHTILMLNLLLLLTIGLLPWTTGLMAAYLRASSGENLAAAIYAASFLAMGIAFYAMQRHILTSKRHLLGTPLTDRGRQVILRRGAGGLAPYALATAIAPLTPYATLIICGLIALFYALPSTSSGAAEV
jgi:uncharacterized membrane protein